MRKYLLFFFGLSFYLQNHQLFAQNYFYGQYQPFLSEIPSPEAFLGYPIGENHTRHDRVVAYLTKLAELSDRASIETYGYTYEKRPLVIFTVSSPENLANLSTLQEKHLQIVDTEQTVSDLSDQPVFVNLGYNVHGNEPSGTEAAMLTAYTLVASQEAKILEYLAQAVVFIDPTINPDGRDRHTHWANTRLGNPKVADRYDMEHNEGWPSGRTNHYWFDLNRDWWLAVHPESQGKLAWYHQWYPNVVTDFHEMGTNSTYFFEPMKANASKDPIMPKENYTKLNDLFAEQFSQDLDAIGSLYFTKEVFDGTYPGYGSSYPDLQGALALLFEQASSRGHLQETTTGEITFAFTIRNQYVSSLATLKAAVKNREVLHDYLQDFFQSALRNASSSAVKSYVFGDEHDPRRTQAFVETLLRHEVEVYRLDQEITRNGKTFKPVFAFVIPTRQPQYRMVQSAFETYAEFTDSVFYDASAWSLANCYNLSYEGLGNVAAQGEKVTLDNLPSNLPEVPRAEYAYLIPWEDYYAPRALYYLQKNGVAVKSAFKPFAVKTDSTDREFSYGTLLIPTQIQKIEADSLHKLMQNCGSPAYAVNTGLSAQGIDLGSRSFLTLKKPKALMLVGNSVSSYEAGEVWHLLDNRVNMPITKVPLRIFPSVDLERYETIVMVSGSYPQLDSTQRQRISDWIKAGNTLITIRNASRWAIQKKLVKESLVEAPKDSTPAKRKNYVDAPENIGKEQVGGAIFEADLDITHPLGFGYRRREIPVYRNSNVWLKPSQSPYATVAKYTDDPHIDGFITERNLETFLKPSASLMVSPLGNGRVILFADNPNFRGVWYGTNRLFLNALFLGEHIEVPSGR